MKVCQTQIKDKLILLRARVVICPFKKFNHFGIQTPLRALLLLCPDDLTLNRIEHKLHGMAYRPGTKKIACLMYKHSIQM